MQPPVHDAASAACHQQLREDGMPGSTGYALYTALDRCSDQVAPLGPRPVVVAYRGIPQQVSQDKPGVARAFANTAIGDDLVRGPETGLALVECFEVISALERAVRSHRLAPGDIGCSWDVATA